MAGAHSRVGTKTYGSADAKGPGQRIPAVALEGLIIRRLRQQLNDPAFVLGPIRSNSSIDAAAQKRLLDRVKDWADGDNGRPADVVREFIREVLVRAQVHPDQIELTISRNRLQQRLNGDSAMKAQIASSASDSEPKPITLSIPARLKRAGKEMKIIVDDGSDPVIPDTSLVRTLVRAHVIRDRLIADRSLTLEEIAKSEGVVPSYATRLFRLTFLAPDIVAAILSGRHPPELTARRLLDDTRLPFAWQDQRQQLGFNATQ